MGTRAQHPTWLYRPKKTSNFLASAIQQSPTHRPKLYLL